MVDFGDTRRYLKVSGIKEISKMGFQDFMDAVLGGVGFLKQRATSCLKFPQLALL